jgi:hypothetical protein
MAAREDEASRMARAEEGLDELHRLWRTRR